MTEPVSNSYYRSPNVCTDQPEGPPDPPKATGAETRAEPEASKSAPTKDEAAPHAQLVAEHDRAQGQGASTRDYVYNMGVTVAGEAGVGPLGSIGGAFSVGVYLDTVNMEVGFYKRVEKRELIGLYTGVSVEGGQTNSRERFDGKSDMGFAEGGALGRVGVAVNSTAGSLSWGLGSGVAAGVARTETTTTPIEQLKEWGAPPLRRGP